MDGLSSAASIIAVLDLTGKVLKYAKAVKDGSSERKQLLKDVVNIQVSLQALQSHIELSDEDDPWLHSVQALAKPGGSLEICKAGLERLLSKLEPQDAGKRNFVKKLGSTVAWPFQAGEITAILGSIEKQQKIFNLAISLDSLALARAIQADVQNNNRLHRVMTSDLKEARSELNKVLEVARTDKETKALEWLSGMNSGKDHEDISARRTPRTGEWVINTSVFESWLDRTEGNVLWCSGIPGSGKTFVSSAVIDFLRSRGSAEGTLAYVYCDYKAHQKDPEQTPLHVAGSLVRQVLSSETRLPDKLLEDYDKSARTGASPSMLSFEDLLYEYCSHHEAIIVIDALDETGTSDNRRSLLRLLKRLESTRSRLFYTTRPGQKDIERHLKGHPNIKIEATEPDIISFLTQRMEERMEEEEELEELLTDELRKEILDTLVSRSRGMFLLPDLQSRAVLDQISAAKIREALRNLPEKLEQQFEDTITRIERQSKERRDLAMKSLMWVAHAREILELKTLRHALAIEPGDRDVDEDRLVPLTLLKTSLQDFAQGLIIIQQDTQQVRLAHFTLFEYLYSRDPSSSWFYQSELMLAERCLTYLMLEPFESVLPPKDESYMAAVAKYTFYEYAAQQWGMHVHRLYHHNQVPEMKDLMYDFLFSEANLERAAQTLYYKTVGVSDPDGFSQNYPRGLKAVHLCAWYGLARPFNTALAGGQEDIESAISGEFLGGWTSIHFATSNNIGDETGSWMVKHVIERGGDVNRRTTTTGETALHIALRQDKLLTLESLLAEKADPEIYDDSGSKPIHVAVRDDIGLDALLRAGCEVSPRTKDLLLTPLHLAIVNYNYDSIQTLIAHGADLEAADSKGAVPLHNACTGGRPGAIELLLDKGANIEAKEHNFLTPIMAAAAAKENSGECVRVLIKRGASVTGRSRANDSALIFAALNGNMEAVIALLDAGADLTGKYEGDDTALHTAASRKRPEVCRLLLERGADIDPRNEWNNTPLYLAISTTDNDAAVRILIHHHADVNAVCQEGFTVLQRAAAGEQDDIGVVTMLLEAGSEVNAVGNDALTPVQNAVANGNIQIARILIERGGDAKMKTPKGLTLLHLGGRYDIAMVQMLVDAGSPIHEKSEDKRTALHVAVEAGQVATAAYLLEKGISIDEQDSEGQTALYIACAARSSELVQLLLDHKASMEIGESVQMKPLHAAAGRGHTDVVRILLDRGANIESGDKDNFTPLTMACESGQLETVRYLLSRGADVNAHATEGEPKNWNSLPLAAQNNHVEVVKLLLENKIEVRVELTENWTALHAASAQGYLEVVRLLLEYDDWGINTNAGPIDAPPLHFAILAKSSEMIELLLKKGADINQKRGKGLTALYTACSVDGDIGVQMTNILLGRGADVSATTASGFTCLHASAIYGTTEVAKVLLARGLDINAAGDYAWTPLRVAIQEKRTETARFLIAQGANVLTGDNSGNALLHFAARDGLTEIAGALLDAGADMSAMEAEGRGTPLHIATLGLNIEVMEILINREADVNAKNASGNTPLMVATIEALPEQASTRDKQPAEGATDAQEEPQPANEPQAANQNEPSQPSDSNHTTTTTNENETTTTQEKPNELALDPKNLQAITLLLSHPKADLNDPNNNDITPLNLASYVGSLQLITLLLDAGASIRCSTPEGDSAVISALRNISRPASSPSMVSILTLLLSHKSAEGYDLNAQTELSIATSLALAARVEDRAAFHLLRRYGADIEARDKGGNTPLLHTLHDPTSNMYADVKFLLDEGADVNAKDNKDVYPVFLAARRERAVLELILDAGADLSVRESDGSTALHWAMGEGLEGNLRLSLDRGGARAGAGDDQILDPNAADGAGMRPLIMAAYWGYIEHARILLENGADIEGTEARGFTPLIQAAGVGREDFVKMLLQEYGPNVKARDKTGWDGLLFASQEGYVGIVRMLLEAGAEVDGRDHQGRTAVMMAAYKGRREVLEVLIERGKANVGLATDTGGQAWDAAAAGGHEDIAEWLKGFVEGTSAELPDRTR